MHDQSMRIMNRLARQHLDVLEGARRVLDVGSMDINGTYRDLFSTWSLYVGLDMEAGPNVNHVCPTLPWDLSGHELFDAVISGQCLEHVERPWLLVPEMARHLRPGGRLVLIAPFVIHEHRYPIDAWRFLPDGMRVLVEDAGLVPMDTGYEYDSVQLVSDTFMVAQKPVLATG